MDFSMGVLWQSVAGPMAAPRDIVGNLTQQTLVKDEVAFSAAALDPVSEILRASLGILMSREEQRTVTENHREDAGHIS